MKRNLSEIKTHKIKTSIKNNDNNSKASLTKSSSSLEFSLISNKTQSTMSTINIENWIWACYQMSKMLIPFSSRMCKKIKKILFGNK